MEYNFDAIPKSEFLHYRSLVERAMTRRRTDVKANELNITQVTGDYKEYDPFQRDDKRILRSSIVGQAWPGFDRIWLRPGRSLEETRVTCIHEIAHLGETSCSHGPKWRRVFGVALAYHLREIGRNETAIRIAIEDKVVRRYRHYRAYTPQGKFNSWTAYNDKVMDEVRSIHKASKR